jgi:hypothetical protein
MDHLLICECGQENIVSRKQAGQEISCSCGKQLAVPTLRGFSELPLVVRGASSSQLSSAEVAKSAWAGWKGPAFALVVFVFLGAALTTAYQLILRSSIDTSFTTQQFIDQGNLVFDEYTAVELSLTWQNFEKLSMGPKMIPDFIYMNKKAKELEHNAAISGGVCLISALLACGVWMSTRKR